MRIGHAISSTLPSGQTVDGLGSTTMKVNVGDQLDILRKGLTAVAADMDGPGVNENHPSHVNVIVVPPNDKGIR
jgi:hypothetical protein